MKKREKERRLKVEEERRLKEEEARRLREEQTRLKEKEKRIPCWKRIPRELDCIPEMTPMATDEKTE